MTGLESLYVALFMMATVFVLLFVIFVLMNISSAVIRWFESNAKKSEDAKK